MRHSAAFCMTYCETHKTMNTRNINIMEYYCVAKKKPMRLEKTKLQTARVIINNILVCVFVVCFRALNFIVIDHYTINIPVSFQAYHGCRSWSWVWQSFPFHYFVSWEVKIMTVSNFYLFMYLKTRGDYWPAVRGRWTYGEIFHPSFVPQPHLIWHKTKICGLS